MNIGIIDADLIDRKTSQPNLVSMKISSYYKSKGCNTTLLTNYDNVKDYDKVFISKVFTSTEISEDILNLENVTYGGTGFFYDKAEPLPYEIEHCMPDYSLYDDFVKSELEKGVKPKQLQYYTDYSVGFTTRGCFRKCEFCVNKNSTKSVKHSELEEFVDEKRKKILLFDDNVLACGDYKEILNNLKLTGKPVVYKQGLDIRLLTEEKIKLLTSLKYDGRFVFAFDNIKDKEVIGNKLKLWNDTTNNKRCMLFVFCGFENLETGKDIEDLLERVYIIMKNQQLPYIMRHENHKGTKYEKLYTNLARWCNQPSFFNRMSFREFTNLDQSRIKTKGVLCSSAKALMEFEEDHPDIAKKYFDIKFTDYSN